MLKSKGNKLTHNYMDKKNFYVSLFLMSLKLVLKMNGLS